MKRTINLEEWGLESLLLGHVAGGPTMKDLVIAHIEDRFNKFRLPAEYFDWNFLMDEGQMGKWLLVEINRTLFYVLDNAGEEHGIASVEALDFDIDRDGVLSVTAVVVESELGEKKLCAAMQTIFEDQFGLDFEVFMETFDPYADEWVEITSKRGDVRWLRWLEQGGESLEMAFWEAYNQQGHKWRNYLRTKFPPTILPTGTYESPRYTEMEDFVAWAIDTQDYDACCMAWGVKRDDVCLQGTGNLPLPIRREIEGWLPVSELPDKPIVPTTRTINQSKKTEETNMKENNVNEYAVTARTSDGEAQVIAEVSHIDLTAEMPAAATLRPVAEASKPAASEPDAQAGDAAFFRDALAIPDLAASRQEWSRRGAVIVLELPDADTVCTYDTRSRHRTQVTTQNGFRLEWKSVSAMREAMTTEDTTFDVTRCLTGACAARFRKLIGMPADDADKVRAAIELANEQASERKAERADASADLTALMTQVEKSVKPRLGKKFRWKDVCCADPKRSVMCGVFHDADAGMLVGSDSIILLAIKADVPKEMDGYIVSPKSGEKIDSSGRTYPNYRGVKPSLEGYREVLIREDAQALMNEDLQRIVRENKYVKTVSDAKSSPAAVYIGGVPFRTSFVELFLRALDAIGTRKVNIQEGKCMFAESDNGWALLIPMINDDQCKVFGTTLDLAEAESAQTPMPAEAQTPTEEPTPVAIDEPTMETAAVAEPETVTTDEPKAAPVPMQAERRAERIDVMTVNGRLILLGCTPETERLIRTYVSGLNDAMAVAASA